MSSSHATTPHGGEHGAGEHAHPSNGFYWLIGAILAVVTFVEVAIFYIEAFEAVEAPLLVILSAAKVVLVVMFFMHLKMDSKVFTWVFLAGVVLATFMVAAMVVIYHYLPRVPI